MRGGDSCHSNSGPTHKMSTLSSLSESFIARRTESVDAEKIAELVKRHTETIFGRTDVQDIM